MTKDLQAAACVVNLDRHSSQFCNRVLKVTSAITGAGCLQPAYRVVVVNGASAQQKQDSKTLRCFSSCKPQQQAQSNGNIGAQTASALVLN